MLQLKRGQRVLDVGGGIGGSAFYMAKVSCTLILILFFVRGSSFDSIIFPEGVFVT